ncbi:MAG TPA: type II secretion system protein [Planctomycetota bacterium]|nr:type II secretion system protein [Planctomycetota bacterium]
MSASLNVRRGFTMLEVLLTIFIIAFLSAALFVGLGKLRNRSQVSTTKTLIEKVKNGLSTYNLLFRSYPQPIPHAPGFSNNESVYYFLTTAFRRSPDTSKGEVAAAENIGPLSDFNEREVRELTAGQKSIIDPWATALHFEYKIQDGAKNPVTGTITKTYTPIVYSCGPNKTNDGGIGDDITAGEQ